MCCAGELDRDSLVMGGGVKPAAFGAAAVIDRPATKDFSKLFQRDVVAGIDEAIAQRRPRDMASIERGNGEIRSAD